MHAEHLMSWVPLDVPYSGNLSREKTFMNFVVFEYPQKFGVHFGGVADSTCVVSCLHATGRSSSCPGKTRSLYKYFQSTSTLPKPDGLLSVVMLVRSFVRS